MTTLSEPTLWEKGEALIRAAEEKERNKQKEEAFRNYERGLELMIVSLRHTPLSTTKQRHQQIINIYLNHAETLKKEIYGNIDEDRQRKKGTSNNKRGLNSSSKKNFISRDDKNNKYEDELHQRIANEILDRNMQVKFDDIVGLEDVKQALLEAVILPSRRPELFTGPRKPPRGLLLFGPPGNGKTYIAKALASECDATFFCISASTLMSRYVGEGEKLVRALFEVARERSPSIIFIDEIDSLLTARGGEHEQEYSRRMKTEFLVQLDGVQSNNMDRVLLIGATNVPWELDEAVLRRFQKRIMVPLPGPEQREFIIIKTLGKDLNYHLTKAQLKELVKLTEGYSASDLTNLVSDAAMGPVRDLGMQALEGKDIPPVTFEHFQESLNNIKPSYSIHTLTRMMEWNETFGSKMNVQKLKEKNKSKQKEHMDIDPKEETEVQEKYHERNKEEKDKDKKQDNQYHNHSKSKKQQQNTHIWT